jgi:hypothetical protein
MGKRGAYGLTISPQTEPRMRCALEICVYDLLKSKGYATISQKAFYPLISSSYKRYANHFPIYTPKAYFRVGKSVQTTPCSFTNLSRVCKPNNGECPFSHLLPIHPITLRNPYEQAIKLEIYCIIRVLHCLWIYTFVAETVDGTCKKRPS